MDFDKYISQNEEYISYNQSIYALILEKENIKRLPRPRLEKDFKEMMNISGKIGGLRRLRRQLIILELTEYFLIKGKPASAYSVANLQRRIFKRSVDNNILNQVYGDPERGPGDRVGEIIPEDKDIEKALKYWKKYKSIKNKVVLEG